MNWLERLIQKILDLFPNIFFIYPNEAGVRIILGKYVKSIGPGSYFNWPVIMQFMKLDTQPQVVDLKNQSITTKDGQPIVISGAVEYTISNPYNTLLKVYDHDQSLRTLTLGVIANCATKATFEECRDMESLKRQVKDGLQKRVSAWGVQVEHLYITDMAVTTNIRILSDSDGASQPPVIPMGMNGGNGS